MKKLIYFCMLIISSSLCAVGLNPGLNSIDIPDEIVTVGDLKEHISQNNRNATVQIIFDGKKLDNSVVLRNLQNLNAKSLHIILTNIK